MGLELPWGTWHTLQGSAGPGLEHPLTLLPAGAGGRLWGPVTCRQHAVRAASFVMDASGLSWLLVRG